MQVSGGKSGLQNLLEREKSNQDDPTKRLETKVKSVIGLIPSKLYTQSFPADLNSFPCLSLCSLH